MFASSFNASLIPAYPRETLSPRDRYLSAISRVQQAEIEYAAYVAEQERAKLLQHRRNEQARIRQAEVKYAAYLAQQERAKLLQQRRNERARIRQAELEYTAHLAQQERARLLQQRRNEEASAAAKRLQVFFLHTAVSSLLRERGTHEEPQEFQSRPGTAKREVPKATLNNGAQLARKIRVRPVRPRENPVIAVQKALDRRLASERNVEIHATIQGILSNLSNTPSRPAKPTLISPALAAVRKLERVFRVLGSEFVFPAQLDFSATASLNVASLPYTPRNAPVRHYEHALNGLLTQLDAIDSQGDVAVRTQRKLVVGMVERALEDLDKIVEGRWKLQDTQSPRAPSPSALPDGPSGASSSTSAILPSDEPTAAAPSSSLGHEEQALSDVLTATSTEDAEHQASPVEEVPAPAAPDSEQQSALGAETSRTPPTSLPEEAQPTSAISVPEHVDVSVVPSAELEVPAVVASPQTVSLTATLSDVEADTLASPESLSVVAALPDEELVIVDSEQTEDSDESASSWSELED
ncbi:hypothetical protein B0H11DRAFT_2002689 [Mycena galericulata]|nr:hypothetical protein B0H11DRAFT_2002689 [Mycena galericulata]